MTLEEVLATIDYDNEVLVENDYGHTVLRGSAPRVSKMLSETALESEVSKLEPHSGYLTVVIRGDWE